MAAALVWFRDDLRLDDQPALRAALDRGRGPVQPRTQPQVRDGGQCIAPDRDLSEAQGHGGAVLANAARMAGMSRTSSEHPCP